MRRNLLVMCWLAFGTALFADGERDNHPDKVRRIPKLGIQVPDKDARALEKKLKSLKGKLQRLSELATNPKVTKAGNLPDRNLFNRDLQEWIPDVEVYHRAVADNLKYQEFFAQGDVIKAYRLLDRGSRFADELLEGRAPWASDTGLVVRGFRSRLDDTVQPYGLVIPRNYRRDGEKRYRLDVWFHGRGETLSETNFIDQRLKNAGYYQPPETIVLHPYGRYSNAFKFAGEVDVLEAIEHVKKQYRIDDDRISVRGFSMGGAGCWQFAALYSDRWFAANPGAGFSETPEFLKYFQKETLKPYPWEKKLWRWYDADDNAANFFNLPLIAYSGEKDIQKQAADLMQVALAKEGISLMHVIGPNTGHRIHPDSQKIIESKMSSLAISGRDRVPTRLRKVTHSLRYNRHYWLTIDGLKEHWEPARVEANIMGPMISVETSGVTGLTIEFQAGTIPFELTEIPNVKINGQLLKFHQAASDRFWKASLYLDGKIWKRGRRNPTGIIKKHRLQGPIDDAFMGSFLMVQPSGKSYHPAFDRWVTQERERAMTHWRRHFRGHARSRMDHDVSEADIKNHHLILWGDPSSNQLIQKVIQKLPLHWDQKTIQVGERKFDSADHAAIMIFPNPLNPEKYVVLNSGFTYREYAYLNNARQVAKLPDWAVVDMISQPSPNDSRFRFPGIPRAAGFFDENWKLK